MAALEAAGRRTGMIGTIATRIGGRTEDHDAHATTPEAPELQAALRAMVDAGDDAVVLETTSHGLALDRVAAVAYDVAILTNLTHEHLELHGTWEAYRDAKLSLFARLPTAGRRSRRRSSTSTTRRPGSFIGVDPRDRARGSSPTAPSPPPTSGATRIAEDASGLHAEHREAPPVTRDARPPPRRPVQRPQRARRGRPGRGPRPRPGRGPPRAWRASSACRAGWSASTRASRSGSSSTSPTARPRSRPSSTSSRPARRPAAAG